ncbi:MAG: hypothetical protein AB4058_15170 [Microcystaceae cyanobacterium]
MSISTDTSISSPKPRPIPAKQLHKIVFGFLGVFTLFVVTYPLAMLRVSRMEKFRSFDFHGKPLTIEYQKVSESPEK